METFNPGYCTIEGATLTSFDKRKVDITTMISHVKIDQDLNLSGYMVDVTILDTIALIHNFPIRGEETLKLQMRSHDLQTVIILDLSLYSVSDVAIQGEKLLYTCSCVSTSTFKAAQEKIITSFRNHTASYCATQLFKKNYGQLTAEGSFEDGVIYKFKDGRKVKMQDSTNTMRVTIPDYAPAQAMQFLAAKAYNSRNLSSTYRFFETIEGYNFVTDEWLLQYAKENQAVKNLYYTPGDTISRDPRQAERIVETLEYFNHSAHVNTSDDMSGGGYYNSVMEIDLIQHWKKTYNYDYKKAQKKYKGMSGGSPKGAKHTNEFIEKTFKRNQTQRVILRDWAPDGMGDVPEAINRPQQNMREIISNRMAYNYHLQNTKVSAGMKGRIDIKPGEVIDLSTLEPSVALSPEQNKRLQGKWLIMSTTHELDMNELICKMELVKYDWDRGIV